MIFKAESLNQYSPKATPWVKYENKISIRTVSAI